MADPQPLSYSRASTFLACRKLYDYRYLQNLTPKVDAPQLTRGKFVDQGLTEAIKCQERGGDSEECRTAAADEIGRVGKEWLASDHVKEWAEYMGSEWYDEAVTLVVNSQIIALRAVLSLELGEGRWETLTIPNPDYNPDPEHDPSEHELRPTQLGVQAKVVGRLDLPYDVAPRFSRAANYWGHVDWLARDTKTGFAWVIDFKVRKQHSPEDAIEYDYQLPGYQACLTQMGVRGIRGCAHYEIRAAVPQEPALLKPRGKKQTASPGVSRAQIATDWQTYRGTVLKHGFNPNDYQDIKAKLKPFDVMTTVYRSEQELENIWAELAMTREAEQRFRQRADRFDTQPAIRRLHIMQCRGCNFQDLCLAELRGHDSEHVKQTQYTEKKPR